MIEPAAAGPRAAYPPGPAARDRFVVARRGPRPILDPFAHQGVLVEDERGPDGVVAPTATVLLTGRECPWRCVMCDLWRYTTPDDTPRGAIPRQLATAVAELSNRREVPTVVKLYNAGSFFDARAVPPADDDAIVQTLRPFRRVIVESHPSLIGARTWRLRDALAGAGTDLEVALGLETAHPAALMALNKHVTIDAFAAAARRLSEEGVAVRAFVLIHPPFVPAEQQRPWLSQSVAFAETCGATAVSLIPTRAGEAALQAVADAGQFTSPRLLDIETAAFDARRVARYRVFVDLWEFHRFASCDACAPRRHDRLHRFNLHQALEPSGACADCGEGGAA